MDRPRFFLPLFWRYLPYGRMAALPGLPIDCAGATAESGPSGLAAPDVGGGAWRRIGTVAVRSACPGRDVDKSAVLQPSGSRFAPAGTRRRARAE